MSAHPYRWFSYGLLCSTLMFAAACGPGFVDSGDVMAPVQTSGSAKGPTSPTTCTDTDGWADYAQAFFQTNCVSCHSNQATYAGVAADLSNITTYIDNNSMPQNATLAAADKTRILAWLNCGGLGDPNSSTSADAEQ